LFFLWGSVTVAWNGQKRIFFKYLLRTGLKASFDSFEKVIQVSWPTVKHLSCLVITACSQESVKICNLHISGNKWDLTKIFCMPYGSHNKLNSTYWRQTLHVSDLKKWFGKFFILYVNVGVNLILFCLFTISLFVFSKLFW
jgi:hypothetical protein